MERLLVCFLFLAPVAAQAAQADFSNGAVILGLEYGPGYWGFDRAHLAAQVGDPLASVFVDDLQTGHTGTIRLGYNILGHATVEAMVTGTGWDLSTVNRGGAGFVGGELHWHPLELVWLKKERPIPLDASVFFGLGYGIAGERTGMDGTVLETGLTASYFFVKAVGAGLFVRGVFPQWNNFYIDYDNRQLAGNTLPLPNGSGGSFWTFGLALTFRVET
jgi:hypothetical protein